ncbi:MAG: hypothetical protein AAF577_12680 [Pseudomonadota bacterium]
MADFKRAPGTGDGSGGSSGSELGLMAQFREGFGQEIEILPELTIPLGVIGVVILVVAVGLYKALSPGRSGTFGGSGAGRFLDFDGDGDCGD